MTRRAKLLALLDANAASASVVNVRALRELDVPRGFCNRESRLCLSQLFKLYSSVLSGSRCSRYSSRFASPLAFRFAKYRRQRKDNAMWRASARARAQINSRDLAGRNDFPAIRSREFVVELMSRGSAELNQQRRGRRHRDSEVKARRGFIIA